MRLIQASVYLCIPFVHCLRPLLSFWEALEITCPIWRAGKVFDQLLRAAEALWEYLCLSYASSLPYEIMVVLLDDNIYFTHVMFDSGKAPIREVHIFVCIYNMLVLILWENLDAGSCGDFIALVVYGTDTDQVDCAACGDGNACQGGLGWDAPLPSPVYVEESDCCRMISDFVILTISTMPVILKQTDDSEFYWQ